MTNSQIDQITQKLAEEHLYVNVAKDKETFDRITRCAVLGTNTVVPTAPESALPSDADMNTPVCYCCGNCHSDCTCPDGCCCAACYSEP